MVTNRWCIMAWSSNTPEHTLQGAMSNHDTTDTYLKTNREEFRRRWAMMAACVTASNNTSCLQRDSLVQLWRGASGFAPVTRNSRCSADAPCCVVSLPLARRRLDAEARQSRVYSSLFLGETARHSPWKTETLWYYVVAVFSS